MNENFDLRAQIDWLVQNTEGVVGLNLDGTVMPWAEVAAKYAPSLLAAPADRVSS